MSETEQKLREYLKRVTTDLNVARRRLRDLQDAAHEPLAVVGMAVRAPGGVTGPDELWDLVAQGRDAVGPFPTDRGWTTDLFDADPDAAGSSYVEQGAFLHSATGFDADFFGISPREALAMDPQQRLLLEVVWEAIEHGRIDPSSLRGSRTGVFAGALSSGYLSWLTETPPELEGYVGIGTQASVLSGRVAYELGLQGPAATVDTACSSSLVALSWAAQELRSGACDLALVGGVTVMATPGSFIEFSRQRGLAGDGRCRSFSADADGVGWGEAAAVLVVERLSDARANGHPVRGLVRGLAVNSDGASNGLTAPNDRAQADVIRRALQDAGLEPADVQAVEAHGTGTTLGDPIEAQALAAAYGTGRDPQRPLWVGSIKSNIAHTQAAAGAVGIIKALQAMRHDTLPATLHLDTPTPAVQWDGSGLALLAEQQPWPEPDQPHRAGVSSFGISGTNAHVILEQAPKVDAEDDSEEPAGALPWLLSAATPEALRGQAERLATHLRTTTASDRDLTWSLAHTRAALRDRAVVVADDRAAALAELEALAAGRTTRAVRGRPAGSPTDVVLVFPGSGAHWAGMGARLLDAEPAFAAAFEECAEALRPHVDFDPVAVLRGTSDAPALDGAAVAQPVSWAYMVATAQLWRSWGVEPSAVIGHSQGEVAAATVAGILSVTDAARFIALRGAAISRHASGRGSLVSVALDPAGAQALADRCTHPLTLAADNAPHSAVLGGAHEALDELLARCADEGVSARRVDIDFASHTDHVEPVRTDLRTALDGVAHAAGTVPFVSTVTGTLLPGTRLDVEHWWRNLREPVRFADAVRTAADGPGTVFVEVGGHPVLRGAIEETIEDGELNAAACATTRRGDDGAEQLLRAAAQAWAHGAGVRWGALLQGRGVDLPTYAFQPTRFWCEQHPDGTRTRPVDPGSDALWDTVDRGDAAAFAGLLGAPDDTAAFAPAHAALRTWRSRSRERALRHAVEWRPITVDPGSLGGRWVLLAPAADEPVTAALAARLRERGAEDVTTLVAAKPGEVPAGLTAVRGATAVVSTLALDDRAAPGAPDTPAGLAATTALAAVLADADTPLWCVTSGAVAAGGRPVTAAEQAGVWGLGLVAALEHAQSWGGVVDLDEPSDGSIDALLDTVVEATEDQVAVRDGGLLGRRLVRASGAGPATEWQAGGTVLVTGATGGVGRHLARWLAERGAAHLLLVSRRGPDAPDAAALVAEVEAAGATAELVAADVADRDAVAAVLDRVPAEHPLTAVFHAAAVLDDAMLPDITAQRADAVLRVKVGGARHLDELTRDRDLAAFVLFSSFAATVGGPGLGNYAPGNAMLEAIAARRRAAGAAATAVAWGRWAGDGMAARTSARQAEGAGLIDMDPATALAALGAVLGTPADPQVDPATGAVPVVVDVAWERFAPGFTAERPSALITELPDAVAAAAAAGGPDGGGQLRDRLAGLDPQECRAALLEIVKEETAATLGHADAAAVPERAFTELGFDSLMSVELRNRLVLGLDVRLPPTLLFDHPTPAALADRLAAELDPAADAGGRAVDGIEALATALAQVPDSAPEHATIRLRLRRLIDAYEAHDDGDADEFGAVTDDEMFSLIDKELGAG